MTLLGWLLVLMLMPIVSQLTFGSASVVKRVKRFAVITGANIFP